MPLSFHDKQNSKNGLCLFSMITTYTNTFRCNIQLLQKNVLGIVPHCFEQASPWIRRKEKTGEWNDNIVTIALLRASPERGCRWDWSGSAPGNREHTTGSWSDALSNQPCRKIFQIWPDVEQRSNGCTFLGGYPRRFQPSVLSCIEKYLRKQYSCFSFFFEIYYVYKRLHRSNIQTENIN